MEVMDTADSARPVVTPKDDGTGLRLFERGVLLTAVDFVRALRRAVRLRPRCAALHVQVVGKAENSLGDDVALTLRSAATDGESPGEEVPVGPDRSRPDEFSRRATVAGGSGIDGTAVGQGGPSAGHLEGGLHHVLAVLV